MTALSEKRIVKAFVAICVCVTVILVSGLFLSDISKAAQESGVEVGAFVISGGENGVDYVYSNDVVTIKTQTAITIRNIDNAVATTDRIVVQSGVDANVTLAGVNIDVSAIGAAAFKIDDDNVGNVTVTLADGSENTLISGENCAGLEVNNGKVIIQGQTLGTGKLNATGGRYGAGIGGGWSNQGNIATKGHIDIEIKSGIITVLGGFGGSGIGGGRIDYANNIDYSSIMALNIKISGGTISATGVYGGAGIGVPPGRYLTAANPQLKINISGGEIDAKSESATGIGGCSDINCTIEITGGDITAVSDFGTAIGGQIENMYNAKPSTDIKITGGEVFARSDNGVGIGDGCDSSSNCARNVNIEISDGKIEANGITGIGTSSRLNDYERKLSIKISGGEVEAVGGCDYLPYDRIGIGGSCGVSIEITGGTVTARASDDTNTNCDGTGIGVGNSGYFDSIKISGGKVYAYGINRGNGIGGKGREQCGAIEITGGEVVAIGGNSPEMRYGGAGICAADRVDQYVEYGVIICDAKVTAQGGYNSPGIGSASNNCYLGISITNSTVDATGSEESAGIGGGNQPMRIKNIVISDSVVTARGGQEGAGIGGGNGQTIIENIAITDSDVTAIGGDSAAGIGVANNGEICSLTITDSTVYATGGDNESSNYAGAGIGGGLGSTRIINIIISGSMVTAQGGTGANGLYGGSGIGGSHGSIYNICISADSTVKAVANEGICPIGLGPINVIVPKDSEENYVYPLVFETDGVNDILIDGDLFSYKKHSEENRVYLYLPEQEKIISHAQKTYYTVFDEETSTLSAVEFEIRAPQASDFEFAAPLSSSYTGEAILPSVTVAQGVLGMGEITVSYFDSNGVQIQSPVYVGVYTVKIDVSKGTRFTAASSLTADSWQYEITPANNSQCDENGHNTDVLNPQYESGGVCSCGKVVTGYLGDVNGSGGEANLRDVHLLFSYVCGSDVKVDSAVADVNGDGRISIRDTVMLFQHYCGRNV